MADFFDVLLSQRAQRALRPDPVDDDLIARVLTAATHAPSAENRQPWVFVVVRDPALRAQIGALAAEYWAAGAREFVAGRLSTRMLRDVDRWATGGLAEAPVIIAVGGDALVSYEALLPSSIFPAVQNLLLAAHALGLGAVLSTLPLADPDRFAALVGFPGHVRPFAVVPLGWPARPLPAPRRAPFTVKTYRDRFGQPW